MTTKNENNEEKFQVDDQIIDTSTQTEMPSIWYT
jgi:hypothetical protein